jgi:hypothetical protein
LPPELAIGRCIEVWSGHLPANAEYERGTAPGGARLQLDKPSAKSCPTVPAVHRGRSRTATASTAPATPTSGYARPV